MNLTDLRKICEAATPGPWTTDEFSDEWFLKTNHKYAVNCPSIRIACIEGLGQEYKDTAEFIATFNPAFVLKLLAVVEEYKLTRRCVGNDFIESPALAELEETP